MLQITIFKRFFSRSKIFETFFHADIQRFNLCMANNTMIIYMIINRFINKDIHVGWFLFFNKIQTAMSDFGTQ